MAEPGAAQGLRRKLAYELRQYLFAAAFLAAFFAAVTTYRRLVLAEYGIGGLEYGWALVKALVLAKLILIGEVLGVGDRFRERPLLLTTLWKTLVFGLFVAAFAVGEHVVSALVHHRPVAEELSFAGGKGDETVARLILEVVGFVPYFAFRELGRVLGEDRVADLFLRGSAASKGE